MSKKLSPKEFLLTILALPHLFFALIIGLIQILTMFFIIRFFSLFNQEALSFLLPSLFPFFIFIGTTFVHLRLFYLIGRKKKYLWLLASVPIFVLSFFLWIFSQIGMPVIGINPLPQFQFASKCEQINTTPVTPEFMNSLHGFCGKITPAHIWSVPTCTMTDIQKLQNYYEKCSQLATPQCASSNGWDESLYGYTEMTENIWSSPNDQPQIGCVIQATQEGLKAKLTTYFD